LGILQGIFIDPKPKIEVETPETHNNISNVNFDIGGWILFLSPVKFPTTKFLSIWGLSRRYYTGF
jgi:hypothetical protein